MISYNDALNVLQETALQIPVREQELPLLKCAGFVLSRDVFGSEDVPHFHNSAMDGFAIRASASVGASAVNPLRFPVQAFIAAGDVPAPVQRLDVAVEIMTGAVMPAGALDAVVRVEDVEVVEEGGKKVIVIRKPVQAAENVRAQGSDFRAGELVAKAGVVVDPEHLMAFASLGISSLWVRKPLKVALLSTGKELTPVGSPRTNPAQIWNSSGPYLASNLKQMGCEVVDFGVMEDDPEAFSSAVRRGQNDGVDVFLSTGAVSMGKHDFVVEALEKLGAKVRFHKAAIRPGKPICFAEFSGKEAAFFGLPGNPVSTAVGLRFFVVPFLRARMGIGPDRGLKAALRQDIKKPEGLRCFYKGAVALGPDGAKVEVLSGQGSYVLSSLLQANCWVELPEAGSQLPGGSSVNIFPLECSFRKGISS